MSLWQMAQAAKRTLTSPASGGSSSISSTTSGLPNSWQTAAFIAHSPQCPAAKCPTVKCPTARLAPPPRTMAIKTAIRKPSQFGF
jgi:hypothetical protein